MNQQEYDNIIKLIEKRDELQMFVENMNNTGLDTNDGQPTQNLENQPEVQQLQEMNQSLEDVFNHFESKLDQRLSVIAADTDLLNKHIFISYMQETLRELPWELLDINHKINSLRSENTSLTSKISVIRDQIEGKTSELKILKESNSDSLTIMNPKQKAFVLMKAIEYKDNETKNFIIKTDWDFEFRNAANESLLDVALKAEDTEMVKFFINHAKFKFFTNYAKEWSNVQDLSDLNLEGQELSSVNFDNTNASGVNLEEAKMDDVIYPSTSLTGVLLDDFHS
ncbi:MAG: hypothetical protein EB127_05325 [Alphaproteobacteria bacterium]|nr:hypothetical protein [Alphaproteobacteria bacterium]